MAALVFVVAFPVRWYGIRRDAQAELTRQVSSYVVDEVLVGADYRVDGAAGCGFLSWMLFSCDTTAYAAVTIAMADVECETIPERVLRPGATYEFQEPMPFLSECDIAVDRFPEGPGVGIVLDDAGRVVISAAAFGFR